MKRFDIAPFSFPNSPTGEVRFEEARDIEMVEVVFKEAVRGTPRLEYLRKRLLQFAGPIGAAAGALLGLKVPLSGFEAAHFKDFVWRAMFDAVAAAAGVCPDRASYEGEAAMLLEARAARSPGAPPYPVDGGPGEIVRGVEFTSLLLRTLAISLPPVQAVDDGGSAALGAAARRVSRPGHKNS